MIHICEYCRTTSNIWEYYLCMCEYACSTQIPLDSASTLHPLLMLEVERRECPTESKSGTFCSFWKVKGGNVVPSPNRTEVESCEDRHIHFVTEKNWICLVHRHNEAVFWGGKQGPLVGIQNSYGKCCFHLAFCIFWTRVGFSLGGGGLKCLWERFTHKSSS